MHHHLRMTKIIRKMKDYIDYLQTLFVASYTMQPNLKLSIEDELEALAVSKGRNKKQAQIDVKQILNLKKALEKLLAKIAEENFKGSTTNKS